jgi:hypothetical protein
MTSPRQWEVKLLDSGRCEPLKAVVHGVLFTTVAVCAAYNTAAWLRRRQRHLAINAVIYSAALWWERCHIVHHLAACDPGRGTRDLREVPPPVARDLSDAA